MPLSRRQFLQLTGITVLKSVLPPLLPVFPVSTHAQAYGRTLQAAPLRSTPNVSADIVDRLWPDTIIPVTTLRGGWYQTAGGYVEKTHLQPIVLLPDSAPTTPAQPPFWGEVIAPVATLRQWCAADAPLVTRIGHGGVMHIIDYLPGQPDWYGLADEMGDLLGWSQATAWEPVTDESQTAAVAIEIDPQTQRMTVSSGENTILRAAISTGAALSPGTYPIERGPLGGTRCCPTPQEAYHGSPWHLHFGAHGAISGVYWHNRFGDSTPGAAVQMPPYLARWLYRISGPGSLLTVANT